MKTRLSFLVIIFLASCSVVDVVPVTPSMIIGTWERSKTEVDISTATGSYKQHIATTYQFKEDNTFVQTVTTSITTTAIDGMPNEKATESTKNGSFTLMRVGTRDNISLCQNNDQSRCEVHQIAVFETVLFLGKQGYAKQ